MSTSTVRGRAALASITIPLDSALAFQHDTPNRRREFVPSFSILPWPDQEDFRFVDERAYHTRLRKRLILQTDPALTVYGGSTNPGTSHGAWIVDEGSLPDDEWKASDAVEDARAFLSFLVGRNLPFHWRNFFQMKTMYTGYTSAPCERPQTCSGTNSHSRSPESESPTSKAFISGHGFPRCSQSSGMFARITTSNSW